MSNTVSSKDYGLESQRTIRYRPKKMTFREYDKKMLNFRPGLKYWRTVLENKNEWDRQKPTSIGGNITLVDYYTKDEIEELKTTDRIAVSTYVQGNGPETDAYTERATAYEIRMALRERFENINTMGLTELTSRFYEVVKEKGHECPDEWFSDMLYLNDLIAKANGTKRTDAEILAHIINVAPRQYNIPLSIISQNNINAKDALSRAQIELRNYWKRNLEENKPNLRKEITIRVIVHMLFQEENIRIIKVKICQEDVEMAKELVIKVGENSRVIASYVVCKDINLLSVKPENGV